MKKLKRQEEIYQIAMRLFAEYGYKKTTMEDVARELDMTKGALYIYVEDKNDLYEKAVGWALLNWQSRVREAVALQNDIMDKFIILCRKSLQYLSEDEQLRRVLIQDHNIFPMSSQDDPYFEINSNSMNMLRDILQEGIDLGRFRSVNVDSAAKFLFSVYKMFIIKTYVLEEGDSPEILFDEAIDLITNGIFNESRTIN